VSQNGESSYFNYKTSPSFVLHAICDAKYIITFVNIGMEYLWTS